ncbi:hypothetical protein PZ938_13705 [Luteipulveratus sp. YIM 133132]|uniref:hypothetical protein n=1 Tax=Luteipulveratus flavus TaxID=3031728 RepID=UPI0023AEA4CC|nr:hypothetical protein [Luteipulveratus sp. YIM 133132]MDE9366664.1 hypothetical protein [Luteipulveratus sp. YIM 133132]
MGDTSERVPERTWRDWRILVAAMTPLGVITTGVVIAALHRTVTSGPLASSWIWLAPGFWILLGGVGYTRLYREVPPEGKPYRDETGMWREAPPLRYKAPTWSVVVVVVFWFGGARLFGLLPAAVGIPAAAVLMSALGWWLATTYLPQHFMALHRQRLEWAAINQS